MKDGDTCCAARAIRRRADGSIDLDFYTMRARDLRTAEIGRLVRSFLARLTRWRSD